MKRPVTERLISRWLGVSLTLQGEAARGGLGSIAVKVANTLLALLVTILLARMLGTEHYGIYAFIMSIVSIVAIPTQFGLPELVVRETAKAQVSGNWALIRGIWSWSATTIGLAGLGVVIAGAVAAWFAFGYFSADRLTAFAWALPLIPLIALTGLCGAALRGLRHVVQGQLPGDILRPAGLLLLVAVTVGIYPYLELTASYAMALHVVAAAIALFIALFLLRCAYPASLEKRPAPVYRIVEWSAAAWPMALISGMTVLNQKTDILMLGILTGVEHVGLYRVAAHGAMLVSFGLPAIGIAARPWFARFHANGQMVRFQRLSTLGARVMLAMALPVALVFMLFGEPLLHLVFGKDYVTGYPVLAILAATHVVHAGFGTLVPLLNMTGYERITMKAVGFAVSLNILLNAVLVSFYGIIGAAIATGVTLIVLNMVLWRAVRSRLGVDSSILGLSGSGTSR